MHAQGRRAGKKFVQAERRIPEGRTFSAENQINLKHSKKGKQTDTRCERCVHLER